MIVGMCEVRLIASWVNSLKEKRMVVKSIIGKVSHRFNVSIAEVDALDTHQTIVIGITQVGNDKRKVEAMLREVENYIERSTEAEIIDSETEVITF